jgi:hypothetical protein
MPSFQQKLNYLSVLVQQGKAVGFYLLRRPSIKDIEFDTCIHYSSMQ